MRKNLSFSLTAILILAIGIGSNIAIFGVVNSVLLKPLPYHDPEQLVLVREVIPQMAHIYPTLPVNAAHFLRWKGDASAFSQLEAMLPTAATLEDNEPEQVGIAQVSPGFFNLLGTKPALGRLFSSEEGRTQNSTALILTDSIWRRRFHSDPAIVGKVLEIDGTLNTIIGVLPRSFYIPTAQQMGSLVRGVDRFEIFRPLVLDPAKLPLLGNQDYVVIGRLEHGIRLTQAEAQLNVIQEQIAREIPERIDLKAKVIPLKKAIVASAAKPLLFLQVVVSTILVIVLINLSSLLMARNQARNQEFGVRVALGATRWQVFEASFLEMLILAGAGTCFGLLWAYLGLKTLLGAFHLNVPRLDSAGFDWHIVIFAVLVALATSALCALFGLMHVMRNPLASLRENSPQATRNSSSTRIQNTFVTSEVFLSTALLIVAGLFSLSLIKLLHVNLGFDSNHVVTGKIILPADRYLAPEQRNRFFDQVLEGLSSIPGVKSAGLVSNLPLQGESWIDVLTIDPHQPVAERPLGNYRMVSPDYLATIGVPLIQGRMFQEGDRTGRGVVISKRTADLLWPGENPIGKFFTRGGDNDSPYQVIGVVGDTRSIHLEDQPSPMVYVPYWLREQSKSALTCYFALRSNQDPSKLLAQVRQAIQRLDSNIPIEDVSSLAALVAQSSGLRRFQTIIVVSFAVVSLLLAALGLYGIVSYSVARRQRELGIRVALGASRRNLLVLVTRQALIMIATGVSAGILLVAGLMSRLNNLLFEPGAEVPVMLAVAALIFLVSIIACLWPIERVLAIHPTNVLRTG